ncbi:MAG: alkane 1-monooxygenase [Paracoccaceae bacterium]
MTTPQISPLDLSRVARALPFGLSYLLPLLALVSAVYGGWTIILLPAVTWYLFGAVDLVVGSDPSNADPRATERDMRVYRWITLFWAPVQFVTLFGMLWYVPQAEHLSTFERIIVFFGVGVVTGTVGINYSHELMHQKPKIERWCADILLAMVLYSHFRSEHLLVHHRYVATPKDPVTARYNEGFHRYYPRVLKQCFLSAFRAETSKLLKIDKPWHDRSNPFWRYWGLQLLFLTLAATLGGWSGIGLFLVQAGTAIWQLELVNYVEHYGLTRKHLGAGKYEHVKPHHSWNADQKVSNWLLINLQRHSDHHYKPDRRFPVLQTYSASQAPILPYGYAFMTILAMMPPLWRRVMNPAVRRWREMYYPEISDWGMYNSANNPHPQ